ncbi:hypothetical protein H1R20_g2189, partial [Candolleomyces eurysporus]
MHFSLALAALVPLAVSAADIPVAVGQGGLTFNPSSVTAAEGDTIVFTFYPKNHTVTQSSFATPCSPLADGEDSGFIPLETTDEPRVVNYVVENATAPLWFYCAQTAPVNHCTGGMVFAINPSAERTFEQFQANARNGGTSGSSTTTGGTNTNTNTNTATRTGTAPASTNTNTAGGAGSGAMELASVGTGAVLALGGLVAGILSM